MFLFSIFYIYSYVPVAVTWRLEIDIMFIREVNICKKVLNR